MRWEKFGIDSEGGVEFGVVIVVWVAIMLDEKCLDFDGWQILPMVVDQGDEANALDPHPDLSAGLRLVIFGNFECMCADEDVCFEGEEDGPVNGVSVVEVDVRIVDDLVD